MLTRGILSLVLILLPLLVGCNELEGWRDGQIKLSNSLASPSQLTPPDPPISIPSKIAKGLPWKPEFVAMSFSENDGSIEIMALSPDDTLQTCNWMLQRLGQLGYDSEDNPSRILEGVDFKNKGSRGYRKIYVKVTMNTADQCIIDINAFK